MSLKDLSPEVYHGISAASYGCQNGCVPEHPHPSISDITKCALAGVLLSLCPLWLIALGVAGLNHGHMNATGPFWRVICFMPLILALAALMIFLLPWILYLILVALLCGVISTLFGLPGGIVGLFIFLAFCDGAGGIKPVIVRRPKSWSRPALVSGLVGSCIFLCCLQPWRWASWAEPGSAQRSNAQAVAQSTPGAQTRPEIQSEPQVKRAILVARTTLRPPAAVITSKEQYEALPAGAPFIFRGVYLTKSSSSPTPAVSQQVRRAALVRLPHH